MTALKTEARWRGRPALSAGLRAFVFLVPIGAAVAASAVAGAMLGRAHTRAGLGVHVGATLIFSTSVLLAADRVARKLLPLAVLLKLSLAFPDEAPSRVRVARAAAGTRTLQARVENAREHGVADEPTRAAERILGLIAAVEAHDRATRGHSERVRIYTDILAVQMGLPEKDRDRLRWAAMLHDVGKLEVPGKILNKPGKLDSSEWDLVRAHPDAGARLVAPLRKWLGSWAPAVEEHHERYDGTGYPRALSGDEISLAGRIVSITDAYETMTAARPYRKALSAAKARAELVRCSGTHFDPTIVRAFLQISVRRLSLVAGPLSWLAQTPLLHGIEQFAGAAGRAATSAATAGGALALTIAPSLPRSAPAEIPLIARAATAGTVPVPSPTYSPAPSAKPSPNVEPSPAVTISPSAEPTPRSKPSPVWSPQPRPSTTPSPGPIYTLITSNDDTTPSGKR